MKLLNWTACGLDRYGGTGRKDLRFQRNPDKILQVSKPSRTSPISLCVCEKPKVNMSTLEEPTEERWYLFFICLIRSIWALPRIFLGLAVVCTSYRCRKPLKHRLVFAAAILKYNQIRFGYVAAVLTDWANPD